VRLVARQGKKEFAERQPLRHRHGTISTQTQIPWNCCNRKCKQPNLSKRVRNESRATLTASYGSYKICTTIKIFLPPSPRKKTRKWMFLSVAETRLKPALTNALKIGDHYARLRSLRGFLGIPTDRNSLIQPPTNHKEQRIEFSVPLLPALSNVRHRHSWI